MGKRIFVLWLLANILLGLNAIDDFAEAAAANAFYVAPGGDDSDTGTLDQPWRTIQKAANTLEPGDTVYVRQGIYSESIALRRSGTEGQWITFANYPGEVPIIENPGTENYGFEGSNLSYIRIRGFVIRGFQYSGISCGWSGGCHHIEIQYNILDDHGQSGVGIYNSNQIVIEHNIASRTGWASGWASGIDLWKMTGKENLVRGNVSFHHVDDSDHHSDGNGFILDLSYLDGGATFENNLAFENGGAGIAITLSANTTILGNTFYHNWRDPRVDWLGELSFDGEESYHNVVMRNNIAYAADGKTTLKAYREFSQSQIDHNNWYPDQGGRDPLFVDPETVDFRLSADSPVIDQGSSSGMISQDIGFDPRCIHHTTEGQRHSWWRYAPDVTYVQSIGGVESCFHPISRPQGTGFDLGAYEFAVGDTFVDVPSNHPYHDHIEALYRAGYTAGCNADPLMYCPDDTMIRAESSVFVERGIHGAEYEPGDPSVSSFNDVPVGYWGIGWIESLWEDGYTAGCATNPLRYCPLAEHTRAEGCVFYLRMLHGADFQPPEPGGVFADVPTDWWGAGWVEAAYDADLIQPCQRVPQLLFCPNDPLTRGLAASMMVQAKDIPLPPQSMDDFFPLGFMLVAREEELQGAARSGVNLMHPWANSPWCDTACFSNYLDRADELGLQMVVDLPVCRVEGCEGYPVWEEAEWAAFITTLSVHQNIAGWYLPDEIGRVGSLQDAARLYEYVHRYDPDQRPVYGNPGTFDYEIIEQFPPLTDFLWGAWYPEYYGTPRVVVTYGTRLDAQACQGTPVRWGSILQFFDNAHYGSEGYPSPQELRNDSYQSIVAGATGLWYYSYRLGHDVEGLLDAVSQIADEIIGTGGLDAVILSPDVPQTIMANILSGPPESPPLWGQHFEAILTLQKEYDGDTYLFAVNVAEGTVQAAFDNLPAGTPGVEALFEGRSLVATAGSFQDTFVESDVHIYRLSVE